MSRRWLGPQSALTEDEIASGLRWVVWDGIYTQIMASLTSGAFLVAFALLLGASTFTIGLLAALQAASQVLQIPAIYLLEVTRRRKAMVVASLFASRTLWFLLALIPWIVPSAYRIPVLLAALSIFFALGTVSGLAWNAWMRDLVPEARLGSYMGKRMAISTAIGAALSLIAGFGVDLYKQHFTEIGIYCIYFVLGTLAGLASVYSLARTPEPQMVHERRLGLLSSLSAPFRDANFRRLLIFLGSWSFAVNLAAPFLTVYMLKRLNLDMGLIIGFSVLSQGVNVLFFHLWGRLADRFSNKSVLAEAGPLFISTFVLWPLTSQIASVPLTLTVLVIIHALSGMSTAGVSLCTANIAMKLAPRGKATPYLAVRSLASGAAATLAPLIGGLMGNSFEGEEIRLRLDWVSAWFNQEWAIHVTLHGLDFLFLIAFMIGLYSLHRLALVKEEGEVQKGVVLGEFNGEVRKVFRNLSNIAGLYDLFYFPYALLLRFIGEKRKHGR